VLYCKDFEFNYLKTTCTYLTWFYKQNKWGIWH
jgi:hypothetical protein